MPITRRQFTASPLALALSGCGGGGSVAVAATPAPSPAAAPSPAPVPAPGPAALDPSLGAAFGLRMPFGAAVTPEQLRDPTLAAFIEHHFRVLVAENAMKPASLSPSAERQYAFGPADELVNFGLARGMKVRGHTLLWHQQFAPWMFREGGAEVSRATLVARLERYIADVVGHFKGRVFAWDVVNEAFQFDEGAGMVTDAKGMRMSDWRRIIGPDYIEIAFRAAAKADPDALLFYNDYETQNPRKLAAMLAMVRDFKTRGIKIDGIGHQMHSARTWPVVADVEAAIDALASTGVTQHVTELDITLNDKLDGTTVKAATPELLAAQAERYRALVGLFLRKRDKVTATLVWGISDAHTWLTAWPTQRFEAPLPFDVNLKAKPAYFALMDVAKSS